MGRFLGFVFHRSRVIASDKDGGGSMELSRCEATRYGCAQAVEVSGTHARNTIEERVMFWSLSVAIDPPKLINSNTHAHLHLQWSRSLGCLSIGFGVKAQTFLLQCARIYTNFVVLSCVGLSGERALSWALSSSEV